VSTASASAPADTDTDRRTRSTKSIGLLRLTKVTEDLSGTNRLLAYCIVRWVSFHPWVVSIGGLGARRIAYSLEGCGLQNLTCGLFGSKPRCDNSAPLL